MEEDGDESCGPERTFVALLDSATTTASMEDRVSYQASSMTRRDVPSECGMKDLSTDNALEMLLC